MFRNVAELVELAESQNKKISDIMIEQEMEYTGRTYEEVFSQMEKNLDVMEKAIERGLAGVKSHSGLTGGDAVLLQNYIASGKSLAGDVLLDAVSKTGRKKSKICAKLRMCAYQNYSIRALFTQVRI